MAQIENVSAPLVVRFDDGSEKVVARVFPHPRGVIVLDTFWHRSSPEEAAHLICGTLRGEGPWRVGNAIIRVLGCAHTDPHLQAEFARWRDYLNQQPADYPPEPQILDMARALGASV